MGEFDDITLDDIEPTSSTVKIPVEDIARSIAEMICKRCKHRAGDHTTVPLEDGSRCNGSDGTGCAKLCPNFVE